MSNGRKITIEEFPLNNNSKPQANNNLEGKSLVFRSGEWNAETTSNNSPVIIQENKFTITETGVIGNIFTNDTDTCIVLTFAYIESNQECEIGHKYEILDEDDNPRYVSNENTISFPDIFLSPSFNAVRLYPSWKIKLEITSLTYDEQTYPEGIDIYSFAITFVNSIYPPALPYAP
jgi:hypothetical protein